MIKCMIKWWGEKSNTFTELDVFGNMIMIFFTSLALYSLKTKTSS